MNPILRNTLAVIAGLTIGGIVNMGLIMISGSIIPPPEGVNVKVLENLKSSIHLFEPRHFVFPFLAHALGTLAGAFVASFAAATHNLKIAVGIGVFFLLGGTANAVMIPAPTWFVVLDLIGAYIPMAWVGATLSSRRGQDSVGESG